ncbi:hypothetical protein Q3G72_032511 [Acer saccharum]|nr:hypothetical protein Q3G72_032511 [Acer saccharum]
MASAMASRMVALPLAITPVKFWQQLRYLAAGRDMIASLQFGARCPYGYCHISDVEFHKKEDHMESFFLAETETNGSKVFGDRSHTGFPSDSFLGSIPATGLIKQGFCPGLTHGQKYGITYLASEDASTTPKESTAVQSHSVVVVSDQTIYSPSKSQSDDNDAQT